jgi:virulence factor
MEQLRIGVIGTGRMGQNHCRVYSNLRRAKFIGVSDLNVEAGKQIARKHEVSFFREIDSLLENVDAVSICTPTPSHYDLVMQCLERNIHVLVEKPFTETLDHAQSLVSALEKHKKLVVQVGHIEHFNPTFQELRKLLEGVDLLAVNFRRLSPFKGSNVDVDVVLDLMIHDIGLVVDLFGAEPTSASAYGFSTFSNTIDHGMAVLQFSPSPLVTLTASRVTEQKVRSIEVTTREAFIEADLLNKSISVHRRTFGENIIQNASSGLKYRQESISERILVPAVEPLYLELQDFVDCVLDARTPQVTALDGLNALKFVLLIRDKVLQTMKAETVLVS